MGPKLFFLSVSVFRKCRMWKTVVLNIWGVFGSLEASRTGLNHKGSFEIHLICH